MKMENSSIIFLLRRKTRAVGRKWNKFLWKSYFFIILAVGLLSLTLNLGWNIRLIVNDSSSREPVLSEMQFHPSVKQSSNGISHNYISKPHEIMSRQYDIPYGVYKGASYKKILYWNRCFTPTAFPENFGLGTGRDVYKKAGCPVWQCETSSDRSNLTDYDAVLFDFLSFDETDLPELRNPNQRYILFDFESPMFGSNRERGPAIRNITRNFFNWTMHYRWDSDVVHPYAWIEPKGSIPLHPEEDMMKQLKNRSQSTNHAAGKTKMAAWMASKCESHSDRKVLIDQLIEYGIEIDIYGSCGNLTCGTNVYHYNNSKTDDTDEPCRQMIGKTYKFYFSLENALCLDYVTEKFYAMMRYPVVLVVMDAHGNHAKAAPPHSYINALDFPSIRHLADYLIELDRNDHLYNEYFWWKEHFTVRNSLLSGMFYKNFCSLCAALHNPPAQSVQKVYKDVIAWWVDDARCQKAPIISNRSIAL